MSDEGHAAGTARRVAVIGAGYVGSTSAACLARLGHTVVCVDNDPDRVARLRRADVPIREPGLAELISAGIGARRLSFTGDLDEVRGCDTVLLCLPTPAGGDGRADLSVIDRVADRLTGLLTPGTIVVVKSTAPVGTARWLARRFTGRGVAVVVNPEFLREGHAVDDFLHPDRLVVGADDEVAGRSVADLYAGLDAPAVCTDPVTAELAKYAANAFLAVKASYANELAELCESVGGDVTAVTAAMGLDPRIGPHHLRPGPGWGGACLPKDTAALLATAQDAGTPMHSVSAAVVVNRRQGRRAADLIARLCGPGQLRLGLLGLTFKSGTDDLRCSPALTVAAELAHRGHRLVAHDPAVPAGTVLAVVPECTVASHPHDVAAGADAVVVLTDWPSFRDLDWPRMAQAMRRPRCIDLRGGLEQSTLRAAGIAYHRIGHGSCGEAGQARSGPAAAAYAPRFAPTLGG